MAESSQQPLRFSRGANVVDGTLPGGVQGIPSRNRGIIQTLKPKLTLSKKTRLGTGERLVNMRTSDAYTNYLNATYNSLVENGVSHGEAIFTANDEWLNTLTPEERARWANKSFTLTGNDTDILHPPGRSRLVSPTEEDLINNLGNLDTIVAPEPVSMEAVLENPDLWYVNEASELADLNSMARSEGYVKFQDGTWGYNPEAAALRKERVPPPPEGAPPAPPVEQETLQEARAGKAPLDAEPRETTRNVIQRGEADFQRRQAAIDDERMRQRDLTRQRLRQRAQRRAPTAQTQTARVGFAGASSEQATNTRPPRPGRAVETQANTVPRAARDFAPRPPDVAEPGISVPTQTVERSVIDAPPAVEADANANLARLSAVGDADAMQLGGSIGGLGRAFSPLVILASIFTLSGENSIAFIVTGSVVSFFTDLATGVVSLLATLSVVGAVPAGIVTLLVGLANPIIFAVSGLTGVLVWQAGKHIFQYFTSEDPEAEDTENNQSTFYSLRQKKFVKVPKQSVVHLKLSNGRTVKHTVLRGEKLYRLHKLGNEDD